MRFVARVVRSKTFTTVTTVKFTVVSGPPHGTVLVSTLLTTVNRKLHCFLVRATVPLRVTATSFFTTFSVNLLTVPFTGTVRYPTRIFSFPSLLPVVPKVFTCGDVLTLARFVRAGSSATSLGCLIRFYRGKTAAVFILFTLMINTTVPMFVFRHRSFATAHLLGGLIGGWAWWGGPPR